jgi:hypothetical protein
MSGVPSDSELLRALVHLAPNTRTHYQKCYRDYCAGDHRANKKYIYDLVMRKVNDGRRSMQQPSPVQAVPIVVNNGGSGGLPAISIVVQAPLSLQVLGAVGLFAVTTMAFCAGMAFSYAMA